MFILIGLSVCADEKIEIKQGKVFINDKLLEEPFEKISRSEDDFRTDYNSRKRISLLLGDNRPESFDSRYWKPGDD